MKNTIASCIKQAIFNRNFLIGCFGILAVLVFSGTETVLILIRDTSGILRESGYHWKTFMQALQTDSMTLATPICAALPFTTSFVDDMKTGFIKSYLPRTNTTTYIGGKITACIVSGGLVLVVGILTAYTLAALLILPIEARSAQAVVQATDNSVKQPSTFVLLAEILMLFFCSGGFWALTGMLCSALADNRFMAYASPFIVYYILIILNERYLPSIYVIYPKEWMFPGEEWMFGAYGVALLMLELIAVCALCFYVVARRRIENV